MKILIVEDEKLLADSLVALLKDKEFDAEAVYDGETGTDYALLGVYDLLILDVMMPGMNGLEVARAVRAKRNATPILMLTARGAIEDRIAGLNAGADYYLTKPFDSRELLACVNALLRRQGNSRRKNSTHHCRLKIREAMAFFALPPLSAGGETLRKLIAEASRNAAMYSLLALKTKGTPHEKTFLRMASEERDLERRLQADHYLLTGDTCPLTPCHPSAPYLLRAIREQYRREQERAHIPLPPLSDLTVVSARHAAKLRDMLAALLY